MFDLAAQFTPTAHAWVLGTLYGIMGTYFAATANRRNAQQLPSAAAIIAAVCSFVGVVCLLFIPEAVTDLEPNFYTVAGVLEIVLLYSPLLVGTFHLIYCVPSEAPNLVVVGVALELLLGSSMLCGFGAWNLPGIAPPSMFELLQFVSACACVLTALWAGWQGVEFLQSKRSARKISA